MSTTALTPEEAAARFGVTPNYLAKLRCRGEGPPYRQLSARVIRYEPGERQAWFDSRRRTSTSHADVAA